MKVKKSLRDKKPGKTSYPLNIIGFSCQVLFSLTAYNPVLSFFNISLFFLLFIDMLCIFLGNKSGNFVPGISIELHFSLQV